MVERRLTVAQILPRLHTGGVERGTLEVAAELVRHGHRSLVVADSGGLEDELIRQGSEHYPWPIGKKTPLTLRLVPRLRRLLRDEQVDIVHARSRLPAWVAYLAWRGLPPQSRPHFVTTFHGFYSVGRYSAIMAKGERVIAVSRCMRDHILEKYPLVDPAHVTVIYRGVDPAAFPFGFTPAESWTRDWYAEFPETKGKYLLTIVGRISRLKGHADFIELIQRLIGRAPNVHGL
ncbi:MAG: glycosyl transferase, partial [Gammaproteobacteria bacterium]